MRLFKRQRRVAADTREQLHPIHLYSAGMLDSPREPMTWMQCPTCGYQTLTSPYKPAETCEGRWSGSHDAVLMVVHPLYAFATAEACDFDNDLIARTRP